MLISFLLHEPCSEAARGSAPAPRAAAAAARAPLRWGGFPEASKAKTSPAKFVLQKS